MSINLGATVETTFTTSPAETGTLVVTAPDGTVTNPAVTGSAGSQAALFEATQLGVWTATWTSPNAGETVETFTVGPALVSLADAKRVAPQAPGQSVEEWDADLTDVIAAVTRHLAVEYGAPMPGTFTRKVWATGTVILPIGSVVTSVTTGATPTVLTGWEHNADAGLLYGVHAYGSVDITYTQPVLPDVREAALLVIRHAWSSRRGAEPVPFQPGLDGEPSVPSGFFVPNRAKELLRAYGTRVA